MILSDITIKQMIRDKQLIIDPFVEENLQPASVDLTLARTLFYPTKNTNGYYIDPRQEQGGYNYTMNLDDEIPTTRVIVLCLVRRLRQSDYLVMSWDASRERVH